MNLLYSFFRSGTSHRLRIALNLKNIPHEIIPVSLRKGEHKKDPYRSLNPQGLVPAFQESDGGIYTQSPAIIEYLEEKYPETSLLPEGIENRAKARAMAALIGCDIHPINNLRILNDLRNRFEANEDQIKNWCAQWICDGFDALETQLPDQVLQGGFAFGDCPGLVECYLIPQVYSANRFDVDLSPYPKISHLDQTCKILPAFEHAHPVNQPDVI